MSLISELQQLCVDGQSDINALLRKTLLAASKLHQAKLERWVKFELNGYGDETPPQYRKVCGRLMQETLMDTFPAGIADHALQEQASNITLKQPLSELQDLIRQNPRYLEMHSPHLAELGRLLGAQSVFHLRLSASSICAVLETVKNCILEWTLNLEKADIHGEGLSFKPDEQAKADKLGDSPIPPPLMIFFGSVNGALFQVNSPGATQKNEG
jgi:hypothetical protein